MVLSGVNFRRNLEFDFERVEGVSYTLDSKVEAEIAPAREHAYAHLHVEFNLHVEGEDPDPPFELSLVVTGMFGGFAPDLPDEEIEGWLSFNAEHLLWPYLRAYVGQITIAAGLPPLTLYTISIPHPHLGHSDEPPAALEQEAGSEQAAH